MKITLSTTNTYKKRILEEAAKKVFPGKEIEVLQTSSQPTHPEPLTEFDHIAALQQSIKDAKKSIPDSSIYVSMLGGMRELFDEMYEVAGVLVAPNQEGMESFSSCTSFRVPDNIAEQVRNGTAFAEAIRPLFKTDDRPEDGFVSLLTNGVVTKYDQYFQATVVALSQLKENH
jgi:non-canonical (house-cleaning) NTP pyrophosphatase